MMVRITNNESIILLLTHVEYKVSLKDRMKKNLEHENILSVQE